MRRFEEQTRAGRFDSSDEGEDYAIASAPEAVAPSSHFIKPLERERPKQAAHWEWAEHVPPDLKLPTARRGSSLSKIGWGEHTLLIVLGGREEQTGISWPNLNGLDAFNTHTGQWCTDSVQVYGGPPKPRTGHAAGNIGRHTLLVYGGVDGEGNLHEGGDLDSMLQQRRAPRPRPGSTLSWFSTLKISADGSTRATPGPRAYHAIADVAHNVLLLFGGEFAIGKGRDDVRIRLPNDEDPKLPKVLRYQIIPKLPPLRPRTSDGSGRRSPRPRSSATSSIGRPVVENSLIRLLLFGYRHR